MDKFFKCNKNQLVGFVVPTTKKGSTDMKILIFFSILNGKEYLEDAH